MMRDSDRREHPNPNMKYVDRGDVDTSKEMVDRIFMVVAFYISYHAKRHINNKYMRPVTKMFRMMMLGGKMDVNHDDFRHIIICALFYAKHFNGVDKAFGHELGVNNVGDDHDEIAKAKGFAKYLLDGEFKDTLPPKKRNQFKSMRKSHASMESLLKL